MSLGKLVKTALPIVVVGLAACGDPAAPSSRVVSLSFTSRAALVPGPANRAPNFDITVTSGTNTIIFTKAQLVVRKIKLELAATTVCADDDKGADDCSELELSPRLVDLPLTDLLTTGLSASIPEGTYKKIEFRVHKPGSDSADVAFKAANPNFANSSIRVEGTFNGVAFVFTSAINEKVEMEFNPPVVVTAATNNVTIQVDIRTWFKNTDGSLISPITANPGQPNEGLVSNKIKASLKAFEDGNKDGK